MTARDVLVAARWVLVTGGWCQHAFAAGDARCVAGAVRDAVRQTGAAPDVAARATRVLADVVHVRPGALAVWNDAPTTTRRGVLAALAVAAERCGP